MRPDIGTVVADEDGDIAHNLNVELAAVLLQRAPLLEEGELKKLGHREFFLVLLAQEVERIVVAMADFGGPGVPTSAVVAVAEEVEEDEIVEPPAIIAAEAVVTFAGTSIGTAQEAAAGFAEQRQLGRAHGFEVHTIARAVRQPIEGSAIEEPAIGEALEADEQRVSGKCRGRGIGRVADARRAKRQDLPKGLLPFCEPMDELVGGGAEVANAAARRQRRRM